MFKDNDAHNYPINNLRIMSDAKKGCLYSS